MSTASFPRLPPRQRADYNGESGVPLATVLRHWWSLDSSRPGKAWQYMLGTLIFNCAFGSLLTVFFMAFNSRATWLNTWVETLWISNCIGFSIHFLLDAYFRFVQRPLWSRWVTTVGTSVSVLSGVALGYTIAFGVMGNNFWAIIGRNPRFAFGLLFLGLLGTLIWGLIMDGQTRRLRAEADALRHNETQAALQRQASEAELRALQAQIEPHFLFNTLANVQALVDYEPEKAKRMLEAFIEYLRATLDASRHTRATLGDEIRLLTRYLDVMQVRMGDRLRYRFDVPEDLRSLPFAPLLLQPLVENAIKYGLEPKIEGGTVTVQAAVDANQQVRIQVIDDGVGLGASSTAKRGRPSAGSGTGMANVRGRLQSMFGTSATLDIASDQGNTRTELVFQPRNRS